MTDEEKAAFEKLLQKHAGNSTPLAEALHRENLEYRRKNAALRTKLDETEKKATPEGALVLTAEQGKAWEAYQKLGVPADLERATSDLKAAQGELAGTRRDKLLAEAAEAHGYKARVLGKMPGLDKLTIEMKTVKVDGKDAKVAHVRDESGQTRTLAEHAAAEWPDFLPALTAEPAKTGPQGTPWPAQSSGGRAPKGNDLVAQTLARNKAAAEAPNPLRPATPAK